MKPKQEKKRHGCRNFILYCLILAGIWYYSTFTLTTTEVTIASEKIQDPITFVQITDLHGFSFGTDNAYLLKAIDAANPDFIVSTGDMFTAGDAKGERIAEQFLAKLAKRYPVYVVNGEHDNDRDFEARLSEAGVRVLSYQYEDISVGASTVRLYGINNVYYTDSFDLHNEFQLDAGRYNIVAAHISNSDAFSEFGADLALCGDTHGGQVRLPLIGALYNRGKWLPEKAGGEDAYTKGLYEVGRMKLFVSSGLGASPLPVRFGNRPEIAVIHLVNGG